MHLDCRIILHSSHDVHGMNAYVAGRVSVRMIQLKNCWPDLDKISYGSYAIVSTLKS
jgi:hypothetical protein